MADPRAIRSQLVHPGILWVRMNERAFTVAAVGGHRIGPVVAARSIAQGTSFHWKNGLNVVDLESQEWALLHRFRRHTYEQRGRILSKWEALFLARHHGLPVRLLDWTTNPLVALYWAALFDKDPTSDGAIWFFERSNRPKEPKDQWKDIDVFEESDHERIKGVRLIYPFYPTQRMTAQSGLFTIHAPPWKDLRDMTTAEYRREDIDVERGDRWIVPKDKKGQLLEQLDRLGINSRTLFPELDGLARGLVHTEVFRSPDQYPDQR